MIVVDTSALTRFFTNDIPSKARQVKKLLHSNEKLYIPDVVFPELEYVLRRKVYNIQREEIVQAYRVLLSRKNIRISNRVITAVNLFAETNLDMADCIIAASSMGKKLFSFDKKLLAVKGAEKAELMSE